MSKAIIKGLMFPLFLLFAWFEADGSTSGMQKQTSADNQNADGTIEKLIVEDASVTMQLDLNGLNGSNSLVTRPVTLQFAAAPNSFLPILVFNDLLRGLEPGSMKLISAAEVNAPGYNSLPAALTASLKRLTLEKLPKGQGFDFAVRDSHTGFTFFDIQGSQYNYDAAAQSFTIAGGRLLISKQFANALHLPSEAGAMAGTISVGAAMQPIQIDHLINGQTTSMVLPPLHQTVAPGALNPGPDVIVGDVEDVEQFAGPEGTQVGFAIGTDSCNNGTEPVDWFALPQTDHPVVPQNLYRMSGGVDNNERFEQIGQSWMKHTFLALEDSVCGTCDTSGCQTGTHLCSGCSDPYVAELNGNQDSIGSRAWINPFTGSFPSNANDHSGHVHNGVSHRILVETSDVMPAGNPGATYFGEAAYLSPHEYTWCQSHPDECNMFNNFSYREFTVSGGPTFFTFSPVDVTVRMQPAIEAWAPSGATIQEIEPDPGNDGKFFVAYKVSGPNAGLWHYEYAIFNMNLDRAIQSFEVVYPLFPPSLTNVGFHAPPQHPGWANDGTLNDQGFSSTPWTFTGNFTSAVWNCETFAQNQNANAVRWGTLYNFRFDSESPPADSTANIGFFKTGSPVSVAIQAPAMSDTTPTPSPTATPTGSPSATPTATATSTPSATPTTTPTPSTTPSTTPRPTPSPRSSPQPRPRPTPAPRP